MHPAFYIRPARVEEAAALSDLCFRSKAVWGYDPEFMALMPAALGVAGEDIAAGDVWVATGADGQIAGVVALAPGDAPGALDLNKLFIEPRHIRSGVGRALLAHAIAEARRRAADDSGRPNAAAFYERAGAVRIGEAPSDAVPGRLLPLYEVRLDSTGDRDLEPHLGRQIQALRGPSAVRASFGEPLQCADPTVTRAGSARSSIASKESEHPLLSKREKARKTARKTAQARWIIPVSERLFPFVVKEPGGCCKRGVAKSGHTPADLRINEFDEMRLEALVCAFLIDTHQARIAHHIAARRAGGGRGSHCSGRR
jgi:GNAT superfamily N-acetyltransferase